MQIQRAILKDLLAEGGEGLIYRYNGKLFKIYKPSVDLKLKSLKISNLMKKKLPENIIKPLDLVFDGNNKFLGYVMDFVDNAEEIKRLSNKKFIMSNNISIKDILIMFIEIQKVVKELHNENIIISDFNDCNIIFDKSFKPYFIDVDSYTVDNLKCDVAMEAFTDPKLISNNFSTETDNYAFAILLFKSLTRIHPFGGILKNNDINMLERMKKGQSIIDILNEIILPPISIPYTFMNPNLIKEMKDIFSSNYRKLIEENLIELKDNLIYCKFHKEYYYNKYTKCPICDSSATVIQKPVQISGGKIPYRIIFNEKDVNINLDYNTYINLNGYIIFRNNKLNFKVNNFERYYSSNDGIIYEINKENIKIHKKQDISIIKKLFNSRVIVNNNTISYIDNNLNLNYIDIIDSGNNINKISTVAINCIFEVYNKSKYFICNSYDNIKIININGYNYELKGLSKIINYGIHYDKINDMWLFIYENKSNKFYTYVFKNNNLIYENDSINYQGNLSNIVFDNKIIFKSSNKKIIMYSYEKNTYKDIDCDIVNEDCKLIKNSNKIIVIDEKVIYEVG
jgi:hypothetical protein